MTTRRKFGLGIAAILAAQRAPAALVRSLVAGRHIAATGTGIPYDAEVAYLESTGTQWIDTGYIGNSQTTEFEIDVYSTGQSSFGMGVIGVRDSTNTRFCWVSGSTSALQVGYGNSFKDTNLLLVANRHMRFSSKISNGTIAYLTENLTAGVSNTSTFSVYGFSTPLGIRLLNIGVLDGFIGMLYSCKLYELGVLKMDLIPVRIGTDGAMFDRVSGQLFRNQGTGSFIIGPVVARGASGQNGGGYKWIIIASDSGPSWRPHLQRWRQLPSSWKEAA